VTVMASHIAVCSIKLFQGKATHPGGHFRIPHLWPGQNPPGTTTGMG
jgi:hypothetical protein